MDNKTFWKTIKPHFTDKDVNHDSITLVQNEETISDNKEISETLSNFFSEVVTNLNLPHYDDPTVNIELLDDPVARAVEKYKNHQSVRLIKENYRNTKNTFHFENVSAREIEKELKNLLSPKAAQDSDIATKVIKDNIDFFTPVLLEVFNTSLANITIVFKKDDRTDKSNYRPVSIYQTCLKFLKSASITNCRCILIKFFLNISVDLEKVLVSSTGF